MQEVSTISGRSLNNPRAISLSFELLRHGGCGSGELTLNDHFVTFDEVEVGHYIRADYKDGVPWYLGRIESIEESSPSKKTIALSGLFSELSECMIGGYGGGGDTAPHMYHANQTVYFSGDPDFAFQNIISVADMQALVAKLYFTWVQDKTNVKLGDIDSIENLAAPNDFPRNMTFRGEESFAEVIRQLAMMSYDASFGVDENGALFFISKRVPVVRTFQEGVDTESVETSRDMSLVINPPNGIAPPGLPVPHICSVFMR